MPDTGSISLTSVWPTPALGCATETAITLNTEAVGMSIEDTWTTCTVGDVSVEVKTRTTLEHDRVRGLMDESAILADLVSELSVDDTFLDVGANIGLYALFAGAVGAKVFAIEPHPANLDSLSANLARNQIDATVVSGALSDRTGQATLYVAADEAGAGTHTFAPGQVSDRTISVSTYEGDALIRSGDISSPTVAKFDVQGAEYLALMGFERALSDPSLRLIYCEVHPEQLRKIGGSDAAIHALLDDHGFAIETVVEKDDVTWNIKATR